VPALVKDAGGLANVQYFVAAAPPYIKELYKHLITEQVGTRHVEIRVERTCGKFGYVAVSSLDRPTNVVKLLDRTADVPKPRLEALIQWASKITSTWTCGKLSPYKLPLVSPHHPHWPW
jgi:hypothetical protein